MNGMCRLVTAEAHEHRWLIMEIIANTGKIHQRLDFEAFEQLLGTDPRELQDLRAVRRPSCENDLTLRPDRMGRVVAPGEILVKGVVQNNCSHV